MLIRKLFKFENAHIVRNCTSDRCKRSIHGHSYKVELLLKASKLDHGQMVYDFGLLKGVIKELFDSFDHAICYWQKDDPEYIAACQTFSARWIALPVSPSAEQFSRIFFYLAQQVLHSTITQNGEGKAVMQDLRSYEETQETLALLKILALGNKQTEEGRVQAASEVIERLRNMRKVGDAHEIMRFFLF